MGKMLQAGYLSLPIVVRILRLVEVAKLLIDVDSRHVLDEPEEGQRYQVHVDRHLEAFAFKTNRCQGLYRGSNNCSSCGQEKLEPSNIKALQPSAPTMDMAETNLCLKHVRQA